MSRHDLDRASDAALFALARGLLADDAVAPDGSISPVTRRCLKAFAQELIDDPGEGFLELDALRAECRVKTRAEFDREIGDLLRRDPDGLVPCWQPELRSLVLASRTAPEGEP